VPSRRIAVVIATIVLIAAACGGGGSGSPSAGDDMLARIKAAGEIRVGTDPNYAPQSFLKSDGTFEGFDIDVANEIAKRLGVTAKFETPDFSIVEAGNWADRFDISVGSVTITEKRKGVLDFTEPYYFTPAQMAAIKDIGITTLDGLAGKKVCVGDGTTYYQWLTATLVLGDGSATAPVPAGAEALTAKTDQDCAQAVKSGRRDADGWLSSSTTVQAAIDAGTPFITVGDPVFYEPLAVATDKAAPPHVELQAELDRIVTEMHEDGTLSALSKKWFDGQDLTTKQ
jgi:polar amino acid transport system substrate-binding protein